MKNLPENLDFLWDPWTESRHFNQGEKTELSKHSMF